MTNDKQKDSACQPGLDDLISLSEAAEQSGLSPGHLRLLVSSGMIWGRKLGRNWFTTAQTVNKYLGQLHKRGPKSKSPK